jgi:hypothetical protein
MTHIDNNFFVDILKILPDKLECFIQAPSLKNPVIERMFQDSGYNYYKLLQLDKTRKDEIIKQEIETSFAMFIQNIKIKVNGILLFEGFDGVEYGTFSKEMFIPEWFKIKYIPDICMISTEW